MAKKMPTRDKPSSAIIVVVDRWNAGYTQAYGNTWIETPCANQLAACTMVMEQAFAESTQLMDVYQSYWFRSRPIGAPCSLIDACRAGGVPTCLVTDESLLHANPSTAAFDQAHIVPTERAERLATTPTETGIARLMAAAIAHLDNSESGLTWIHCRGMAGDWDAPWTFRAQFADDEDPDPPADVRPPTGPVPTSADPDEILGWVWAYAGQAALLDNCLQPIVDHWLSARQSTLLIVTGARGVALGEHGHWGDSNRIHSPSVHVPLFVGSAGHELSRVRSQRLTQSRHLFDTVADWFRLDTDNPAGASRPTACPVAYKESLLTLSQFDYSAGWADWPPLAVARLGDNWLLRTQVWSATIGPRSDRWDNSARGRSGASESPTEVCELYLKPDDAWDVNDVAELCPDVVAQFRRLKQQLQELPAGGDIKSVLPLNSALVTRPT